MSDSPVKVSVVIATYSPGKGLNRLIRSLDAQTLPHDEWEAIFVDDGSPDDTYDRLLALARTRPNMRVEKIENSGWPCRPRNVGTDMARGEYVVYMDHDDALYPDALRAGYEFAAAARADALNGKEARTHLAHWAIDSFREDAPQVLDRTDAFALSPTNPHKMYRRALLDEHGIRFREGGRVLWEDIFFNVLVAKHARVIATLSSVPFYHWYTTKGSGSTTFLRSGREWWYWFEQVLEAITSDLAEPRLAAQRDRLMEHQYRSRLLDAFNNHFSGRPGSERRLIFENAQRLQALYFPEEWDRSLNRSQLLRAHLLRRGHRHVLDRLTADDPSIPGWTSARRLAWEDGTLVVELDGEWSDKDGARHRLRADGDRILKDLPPEYAGEFAPEETDVTDELAAAAVEVGVRNTRSRITWPVATESETWTDAADGRVVFGVRGTARIDPATAAFGNPLERGVWEISGRMTLAGQVNQRTTVGPIAPAVDISERGVAAAYERPSGGLVLDFDQTRRPLTDLVRPTGEVRRSGDTIAIALSGLPTGYDAVIPTTVAVNEAALPARLAHAVRRRVALLRRRKPSGEGWHSADAAIRIADGRAWLELPAAHADGPLRLRLGALAPGSPVVYALSADAIRPVAG